jgi:shikimate kinase
VVDAKPVVVIVGAPGAGKTRLGKRVARTLGVPFIDTDKRIVAEHGPISEIFTQHGEPAFRAIERETVVQALREHAVVTLGGGAVLNPHTQADLADERVIQITVSPEAVIARISNNKRPLLADGVDAWVALVAKRKPIYDRVSARSFDTSSHPLDTVAEEIVQWIRETGV